MAIYPDPPSDANVWLLRDADLPTFTDFTAMGWFRFDVGFSRGIFYFGNSAYDFLTPYIWINTDAGFLSIEVYDGGSFFDVAGSTPLTDGSDWWHLVMVKTGDLIEVYVSDESGSILVNFECSINVVSNVTPLDLVTGVDRYTAVQDVKMWDAALTPTEIAAERLSSAPVRTADIYLATPLPTDSDLTDTSGLGHDWAIGAGTLATAGPPDLGGGGDPPLAPSDLSATPDGFQHMGLTWTVNSPDATQQELQRCTGTGCTSWATIAILGPTETAYRDPLSDTVGLLQPAQVYRYRLRATNFVGDSDWTDPVEASTAPNYAVTFPGPPGTYYHTTNGLARAWVNTPFGSGGIITWIKVDAEGYATIATSLQNFNRCFLESVIPTDTNEWDYTSVAQTWTWFGVKAGKLTFEAQDGRIAARGLIGRDDEPFTSLAARDAAIAAFRTLWADLPYGDGLTVPIPTRESGGGDVPVVYFATFPNGFDGTPHDGQSFAQTIQLVGPTLTPGQWYRVGYRWVSLPDGPLPPTGYTSSTLELWVDCVVVASAAWDVSLQGGYGFAYSTAQAAGGRYTDLFVGGDPNDKHLTEGDTPVSFALVDFKDWDGPYPPAGIFDGECDCDGVQPPLWWPLRDVLELDDLGSGTPFTGTIYPALPVGSPINIPAEPFNPCNVSTDNPPPPPPPDTGTVIVLKQVVPSTDPAVFGFTANVGAGPVGFGLSNGQSRTFTEVAPGSGYSVVEAAAPGYATAYSVSNGSPNTNLSVAAGETVTVLVVNQYTGTPTPPPPTTEGCVPTWPTEAPSIAGCAP